MSKTVLFALANLIAAALTAWLGIEVDEELKASIADSLEWIVMAALAVNGTVVWILRMKTKRPMNGLLIKRPEHPAGE